MAIVFAVLVNLEWGAAQSGFSVADEGLRLRFERELRAKNEKIATICCLFSQTRELAVLTHAVKKTGKFYFKRPDCMMLAFDDGEYIKMTESWFEIKNADKIETVKVTSNPMLKNMSAILSVCVVGDFGQIDKGFEICIVETATEWVVTMQPKRGAVAAKLKQMEVYFDRADMSLNRLKMIEKSTDYTQYDFWRKQFDVDIDSQIFNIGN